MSRVQSIERAFAVLGALAAGPSGVTDVAERVGLPKSTVARLLASLAHEGAVEQVPGETRYRIGPRVSVLAAPASPEASLVAVARPILDALAASLGEAAGLSVRDGRDVRYVDQASVAHEVQVRDWTGTRAPLYAVSSGHVFLAALAPPELEGFLEEPLVALTPRTLTTAAALRERLERVRRDGNAWVRDEFAEGISSVAAPVLDVAGHVAAAVHVHGPSYRFPPAGSEREIAGAVVTAARTITARTGASRHSQ